MANERSVFALKRTLMQPPEDHSQAGTNQDRPNQKRVKAQDKNGPKDEFLHRLLESSLKSGDDLSEQIRRLSLVFTENHLYSKQRMVEEVRHLCTKLGPDVKPRIFDSTLYCYDMDFWMEQSSINIDLSGNQQTLNQQILRLLDDSFDCRIDNLQFRSMHQDEVRPDWCPFEYVVRRVDPTTGQVDCEVEIFMSLNNSVGVYNSHVISYYKACDRRAEILDTIIRLWYKKNRKFLQLFQSEPCDLHFQVMLIYYLQRRQVLPNLQDVDMGTFNVYLNYNEQPIASGTRKATSPDLSMRDVKPLTMANDGVGRSMPNLADLLVGFFEFYLYEFDYQEEFVNIRPRDRHPKYIVPDKVKKLVVLDPYHAAPLILVEEELYMFLKLLREDFVQLSELKILTAILIDFGPVS